MDKLYACTCCLCDREFRGMYGAYEVICPACRKRENIIVNILLTTIGVTLGYIGGIVIGTVVLFLLSLLGIVRILRRYKKGDEDEQTKV